MAKMLNDKDTLEEITPEILAKLFWNMDGSDQAKFYNHLDEIAEFKFPVQLQCITEDEGLTLSGRRCMQMIGEYSHWGVTCRILNGKDKP